MQTPPHYDSRVAIVHDWLYGMRGGEYVLEQVCGMWPLARIHTLFYEPQRISTAINRLPVHPSLLQRLPRTRRIHRYLLPLYPWAMKRMRLDDRRLVISVSSCAAKAAPAPRDAVHVCYCLSPARYFYDQYDTYFGEWRGARGWAVRRLVDRLIRWDKETAQGVTHFLAISRFVAQRIEQRYGREAEVVYPFAATDFYSPGNGSGNRSDFYLTVAEATPYKRLDLIVEAFNRLGLPLVVVTRGPELERLRRTARSNVSFNTSRPGRGTLRELFRSARGFVFAAEEDFGITPVEAQACGCPVIALGRGGTAETVVDGQTGLLYAEQTADALAEAVAAYDPGDFDPSAIRKHAERFSVDRFRYEFASAVARAVASRES